MDQTAFRVQALQIIERWPEWRWIPEGYMQLRWTFAGKCQEAASGDVVDEDVHIVWSQSYRVPVLYMHLSHSDGASFTVEEAFDFVSRNQMASSSSLGDPWSFLTKTEHPVLGVPFLHVHPCRTPDLMALFAREGSAAPLFTWLSLVMSLIGVRVPGAVASAFVQEGPAANGRSEEGDDGLPPDELTFPAP
ncbi:putative ubiquitin-like-conjugating enzyme ATG10 [Paratrimastix pyriformis]|uniref:Ubiquitin-like-conjugating enzyme ATG10 n=1 Tax=Paratrimastix pyriformis TaxID=342808 RepID=A0ABQ8UTJ1_9EUKA|nr:putative ubiquitin-like-conjugating enzyme ATG10 [Paratrimastix pyriformis]